MLAVCREIYKHLIYTRKITIWKEIIEIKLYIRWYYCLITLEYQKGWKVNLEVQNIYLRFAYDILVFVNIKFNSRGNLIEKCNSALWSVI